MMPLLAHAAMVAIIFYSVICRARHMDTRTKALVKWQHALMSAGALFSLVMPMDWAPVSIAAGAAAFLVLGAARWRGGAPKGIYKDQATTHHLV